MQVNITRLSQSDIDRKLEPEVVDGFEIVRADSKASSSDCNELSPLILNRPTDHNPRESDDSTSYEFVLSKELSDVECNSYQPGAKLKLPQPVISKLKHYVQRLEKATGRYNCTAAIGSCSASYEKFDYFIHHIKTSHSVCRLHRCIFCGNSVAFENIKNHIDGHFTFNGNDLNRYACPYCLHSAGGNRQRDLRKHIHQHHSDSLVKYPFCRFCSKAFRDVADYCRHLDRNATNLYHCPLNSCLVKSPDKMLILSHIRLCHNTDSMARFFRCTRHYTCDLKPFDKLSYVASMDANSMEDDTSCRRRAEKQCMPVIVLDCPICETFKTRDYSDFIFHVMKCNNYRDGEEVEACPEETEVEITSFFCSSCGAISTSESALYLHLRSGYCRGIKASIFSETSRIERYSPALSTPRHRRPSANLTTPQPESCVASHDGENNSSESTETIPMTLKDEPVFLVSMVGSAIAKFDREQLMSDTQLLGDFDDFTKLREVSLDFGKMQIAVYSSTGGDHVYLCPRCSQHFTAGSDDPVQRLGLHVFVDHYKIPSEAARRSVHALQLEVTYTDGRQETLPKDARIPMVIKDEPVSQETCPALTAESTVVDVESQPPTQPENINKKGSRVQKSKKPEEESVEVDLLFSEKILDIVVGMVENKEDHPVLRECVVSYSCVKITFNGKVNRYNCHLCKTSSQSFGDIRRHVIQKHCDVPQRLLPYCMILVRQQVCGIHKLLPDDLYERIILLPTVYQNKIHYQLTTYIKNHKGPKSPTMSAVRRHAEALCVIESDGISKSKTKSKDVKGVNKDGRYLKTVFKSWKEKSHKTQKKIRTRLRGKPGKLMPGVDLMEPNVDIDADSLSDGNFDSVLSAGDETQSHPVNQQISAANSPEGSAVKKAVIRFDKDVFMKLAKQIDLDDATTVSVIKKMIMVRDAKITCKEVADSRVLFACECGNYEEQVQNADVTDGPRRHALRAHVRISKIHWSLCLQSTSLVFSDASTDGGNSLDKSKKSSDTARATTNESSPGSAADPLTKQPAFPNNPRKRANSPASAAPQEPKRMRVSSLNEGSQTVAAPPHPPQNVPQILICGFKLRNVDKSTHPLAFVGSDNVQSVIDKGYVNFSVSSVSWEKFAEWKPQFAADPNAGELKNRAELFGQYRVYTRNDEEVRAHICSACGFASGYTSRDVRRHTMVSHLGINVELVTGLLNACEVSTYNIQDHSKTLLPTALRSVTNQKDQNSGTVTTLAPNDAALSLVDNGNKSTQRKRARKDIASASTTDSVVIDTRLPDADKHTADEKQDSLGEVIQEVTQSRTSAPRRRTKGKRNRNKHEKEIQLSQEKKDEHASTSTDAQNNDSANPHQSLSVQKLIKKCSRAGMTLRPMNKNVDYGNAMARKGKSFLDIPAILKDPELQPVVCLKMLEWRPAPSSATDAGTSKQTPSQSKPTEIIPDLCVLKLLKRNKVFYRCSKCPDFERIEKSTVMHHLSVEHANPTESGRFQCPQCSNWFKYLNIFRRHLKDAHKKHIPDCSKFENRNWISEFVVHDLG